MGTKVSEDLRKKKSKGTKVSRDLRTNPETWGEYLLDEDRFYRSPIKKAAFGLANFFGDQADFYGRPKSPTAEQDMRDKSWGDMYSPREALYDLTGGYDLSKKFYLGVNSTYNKTDKDGFYGVALYPQYNLGKLTAGLRGEYFAEINNGVGAIAPDANVINFTTTLDYAIDNLNLKLEYRLDKASEQVFEQKDNLSSIVLAAVYSFN